MPTMLKTPLHSRHIAAGARMASFADWDMPIQYESIVTEHLHTRSTASIFDICHMGEFLVHGPQARQHLERALSHRLDNLEPGKCRYGFLLTPEGSVLDDLIVYCLEPERFMLVVNAACTGEDFTTLRERLPESIKMEDVSSAVGKIDLQGPFAVNVLQDVLKADFSGLGYFSFRKTNFGDAELLVSRTGYTGELGVELYLPWDETPALWDRLAADNRVHTAGLGARDTLRLESGLPLYGHELDAEHTPAEAGLDRMLTSEAEYVGKAGARRVTQRLIPLRFEGRRTGRAGDALALPGGDEVGRVTSASFAPSLGYAVALAWADAKHADATRFIIHTAKSELPAERVSLPFYTQGTARRKIV